MDSLHQRLKTFKILACADPRPPEHSVNQAPGVAMPGDSADIARRLRIGQHHGRRIRSPQLSPQWNSAVAANDKGQTLSAFGIRTGLIKGGVNGTSGFIHAASGTERWHPALLLSPARERIARGGQTDEAPCLALMRGGSAERGIGGEKTFARKRQGMRRTTTIHAPGRKGEAVVAWQPGTRLTALNKPCAGGCTIWRVHHSSGST